VAEFNFILENEGGTEYNDSVYDRLFELENFTYQIKIRPQNPFWRFGIRFSPHETVEFYAPQGRYNNSFYPNVELVAGDIPEPTRIENPNHVHLSGYWLPGLENSHIFNFVKDYTPMDEIIMEFLYKEETEVLTISWRATPGQLHSTEINLKGLHYFKIFGWADWHPYRIEGTVNRQSVYVSPNDRYFLVKMDKTWNIRNLRVGYSCRLDKPTPEGFLIRISKDERPQIEYQDPVKNGDRLLGYDSREQKAILYLFEAQASSEPRKANDSIQITVVKLFDPSIRLQSFSNKVTFPEQLEDSSPSRLMALPSQTYFSILGLNRAEFVEGISKPIRFSSFYLTEGNHEQPDKLDFRDDVEAIASVIAQQNVQPPLAVGLFGNWGSGKSFFMKKLADAIEAFAVAPGEGYVKHVVQVKFNSWHYSDTNLWASLTSQIFESLHSHVTENKFGVDAINSLYRELHITGYQLVETKKKLSVNQIAEDSVKEQNETLEEIIKQKKEKLETWTAKDFVKIVFNDPFVKNDFQTIKSEFEAEKLIDNINQIDEKLTQINSVGAQVSESFTLLKKNSLGRWVWVWLLAILFAVLCWLALGPLKKSLGEFFHGGYLITGLILTWLANLMAQLRPYFKKIREFYRRLTSLKETIEKEKNNIRLKEHDEVDRLQKDIVRLAKEKQTLEWQQNQIQEKKAQLEKEIAEIGSGKLLANFLAAKSLDDAYIKQLGLISLIRKYFAKLNELFQHQKLVKDKERELIKEVQVERIILYIDDLDRCNENVVMAVLEAIHLLLAFPLFVVVVGVDPRWLNNALDKKLGSLFGVGEDHNNSEKSSSAYLATSYDYLEKIFQIPFAIKSIEDASGKALIAQLLEKELYNQAAAERKESAFELDSHAGNQDKGDSQSTGPGPASSAPQTASDEATEPLRMTREELRFMQRLSPIFARTPRHINRYVNIYRILKSQRGLKIDRQDAPDEYYRILFLLAVLIGYPQLAAPFFKTIKAGKSGQHLTDLLSGPEGEPFKVASVGMQLASAIPAVLEGDFMYTQLGALWPNLELVSRFSFRTIEL
jgi:KAP family P-loop domain